MGAPPGGCGNPSDLICYEAGPIGCGLARHLHHLCVALDVLLSPGMAVDTRPNSVV